MAYKSLPEIAGNTRVYPGDSAPSNVIGGSVDSTNPTGTTMLAIGEGASSRAFNRAFSGVGANADRLYWNQRQEIIVPTRVAIGQVSTFELTGRFWAQGYTGGYSLGDYTKVVDSSWNVQVETVTQIDFDNGGGYARCDNKPPGTYVYIVFNLTGADLPTMGRNTMTFPGTVDLSLVSAGDIVSVTTGNNEGEYLVDDVSGQVLTVLSDDGEPIAIGDNGNGGIGLDTTNGTEDRVDIVGNGYILINPRVTFSAETDAGDYLIIGQAQRAPFPVNTFMETVPLLGF